MCTQEKAHALSGGKATAKSKTGTKQPSTGATMQVSKKVFFEKLCKPCKKHGGVHITHATKDCCKYEKDGMAKADFYATKKTGKKPNPAKQSFAQLGNKLDKLKKSHEKASLKSKKHCKDNSNSNNK
jgi:hypothetical protein